MNGVKAPDETNLYQAGPGTPVAASQEPATDSNNMPGAAGYITWAAPEYIERTKPANWFPLSIVTAVIVSAIVWLLTRDLFPTTAVLIGVILLGVYGMRKPAEQTYQLDPSGLTIGARHYPFSGFRSFSVMEEDAMVSLEFAPLRRLAMYITIYCKPADEARVVGYLSNLLPMEAQRHSLSEDLMRRIHF